MSDKPLKFTPEEMERAEKIISILEKRYQKNHPCPKCGSHNVHIECYAMGGGFVAGKEWCDDCKWEKVTDTFPKGSDKTD